MYVSVNEYNEIKEVGISTNPSLTALYIDDTDNPFVGWSEARICCYKINVKDGIVQMLIPYVDSRFIDHIDQLGKASEHFEESKKAYIDDTKAEFVSDRLGMVTCSCITESGKGIPCSYEVSGNRITVKFEKLEEVATVTVRVQ